MLSHPMFMDQMSVHVTAGQIVLCVAWTQMDNGTLFSLEHAPVSLSSLYSALVSLNNARVIVSIIYGTGNQGWGSRGVGLGDFTTPPNFNQKIHTVQYKWSFYKYLQTPYKWAPLVLTCKPPLPHSPFKIGSAIPGNATY